MALWFDLMVNMGHLGTVGIRCREHLDLTNQAAIQDAVSTYEVSRSGRLVGTVRHRYGDGAWRLLALASALIADKDANTPRGPLSSTESARTAPPRGGGCIEPPEALTEADRGARLIRVAAAAQQEYEDSLTAESRVAHPAYLGTRIAHAIRPLLDATTKIGGDT